MAGERHRSARNPRRVIDAMWKTGKIRREEGEKRRQKSSGSVDADPDDLENTKEETQGAEGSSKNCRESVSP